METTSSLPEHGDARSHRKVTIKPFVCAECGRCFTRKFNLQAHIRGPDHRNEKPFQCEQCLDAFTRYADLKRHQNSRHNNILVCCRHCPKQFTRRAGLKQHLKTQHPGKNASSESPNSVYGLLEVVTKDFSQRISESSESDNGSNASDRGVSSISEHFPASLLDYETAIAGLDILSPYSSNEYLEQWHIPIPFSALPYGEDSSAPLDVASTSSVDAWEDSVASMTQAESINHSPASSVSEGLFMSWDATESSPSMSSISTGVGSTGQTNLFGPVPAIENFSCLSCLVSLDSGKLLADHLSQHLIDFLKANQRPFPCAYNCGATFDSITLCNRHLNRCPDAPHIAKTNPRKDGQPSLGHSNLASKKHNPFAAEFRRPSLQEKSLCESILAQYTSLLPMNCWRTPSGEAGHDERTLELRVRGFLSASEKSSTSG